MIREPLLAGLVASVAACTSGGTVVVTAVAHYTGVPMDGIRVQVGDASWVTTGADGKATFDGVSTPYTVTVDEPDRPDACVASAAALGVAGRTHGIYVLQGRTESEVVVEVDGSTCSFFGWPWSGVSGSVSGLSGSPSSKVEVSEGFKDWSFGTVAAADGSFSDTFTWQVTPTTEMTLRAWESDGAVPPTHYFGFGSTTVPLAAQGDATGVSIGLQPVTEGTVDGSVSIPSTMTVTKGFLGLFLHYGDYEHHPLGTIYPWTPAGFSVVVPLVADAEPWLYMQALGPGGSSSVRRRVAASSAASFAFPSPPQALEPADGATIGHSTVFRWTPGNGAGRSTLEAYCEKSGGTGPWITYVIETDRSEATLPDVPGVTLPAGTDCNWAAVWRPDTDPSEEQIESRSYQRTATTS